MLLRYNGNILLYIYIFDEVVHSHSQVKQGSFETASFVDSLFKDARRKLLSCHFC